MSEAIARRFEGRWLRGYVRGKLRSDPVYAAAFELLRESKLPVLDVGCGIGLFALSLRERGFRGEIVGIDFDEGKIAQARQAADGEADLHFRVQDAAAPLDVFGHVVILDVLHYLEPDRQRALLEAVAERIPVGGICLIRQAPRDASWRFRLTQMEEVFLRVSGWMKSGARHYPTLEEMSAPFRARGFEGEVRPLWGRTPFNSHLLFFRKLRG